VPEKLGAVKAEGLEKVYPKGKVHAVRGVSFNLSKVLAVVGPNGAGKTTLHSMLNFLKRRTKGKL
jgi:ABC-type multidrug transport system ATPase subunit